MNRKNLKSLEEIATMIRDREMAELARLNAARHALEDQRAEIGRKAIGARREGQENIVTARAAEAFDRWSTARQAQISKQLAELQPAIEAQKLRTATAAGRHRNITEISKTTQAAERKKADRAP